MSTVAFYVVESGTGTILRSGHCSQKALSLQAGPGETVRLGSANDRLQKEVDGKLVDKTPEEIEAAVFPPLDPGAHPAVITVTQWQELLARVRALETGRPEG